MPQESRIEEWVQQESAALVPRISKIQLRRRARTL